jgi:hypothetical protein
MSESDQHHSAGSDCDSFIIMSASYSASIDTAFYQVYVPDDRETTTSAQTLHSRRTGTLDSGYPISLPDFLIPGDIVKFDGHWAMVMYVNRRPSSLKPNIEQRIQLIEATDWGRLRVMNEHTINSYTSLVPPTLVLGYFRLGVK